MKSLLAALEARTADLVSLIRQLVEIESPSREASAAARCAGFIAAECERRGAAVTLHPHPGWAPQLEARFPGRAGKPILLLGHYDTVWELGTLATMPFRQDDGRLHGPGVFDMKSGIALMLFALDALRASGELPRPVIISLNADEEVGSEGSRSTTEALARQCEAVLVVEPAQGTAVKTARKGVGDFQVKVTGVAAHAGLDFAKGQNAAVELAHQVQRIAAFTELERGLTVSVGYLQGGTKSVNVVPAEAFALVDVRVPRLEDGPAIERKFRALTPVNPHCKLEVSGGINRPPLERTPAVAALYGKARSIAAELGFDLPEAAVGGGSDGNFTGALGIPTLDGLGAVGEGAHAPHESVLIEWLPRRAALLAGLLARV